MLKKLLLGIMTIALLVIVPVLSMGMFLSVNVKGDEKFSIAPPRLAPPGAEAKYQSRKPTEKIGSPDGRPIAQLAKLPNKAKQAVAVSTPGEQYVPSPSYPADEVSFEVLSSVRYTEGNHTVLVTTARPSPAVARFQVSLGNQVEQLPDGSPAWFTRNEAHTDTPQQLVFQKDGLIITVASDLSLEELKAIAGTVTVSN